MSEAVIVVGIDGSEGSRRALRWALEEARLRGTIVEGVTVWPARGTDPNITGQQAEHARRHADEMQRHVIDGVLREFDAPPTVSYQVVHGDVIEVLLRMSTDASLLVIGSHGTSSVRHGALGSVSEALARLADCPVVVLPVPVAAPQHGGLATTQSGATPPSAGTP